MMPATASPQRGYRRDSSLNAVNEALVVVSYLFKITCLIPLLAVYAITSALQCLALAIWERVVKAGSRN